MGGRPKVYLPNLVGFYGFHVGKIPYMDPMGHRFPQEIWRHGEAFFSHLGDTFLDLKDEKKRFQNARLKTNHII